MQDNYILRISHNEQLLHVQGGSFQSWAQILISVTLVMFRFLPHYPESSSIERPDT